VNLNIRKRDEALEVIALFVDGVTRQRGEAAIECLTDAALDRLLNIQGARSDRKFLARSVTQIATALRRSNNVRLAEKALNWAVGHGAVDAYVVVELLNVHLSRYELLAADRVMLWARDVGLASRAMYSAAVAACARDADWSRAQRLFECAKLDRLLSPHLYTGLITTYGRAGLLEQAASAHCLAQRDGAMTAASYAALICAYGKCGDLASAERTFRMAMRQECVSTSAYTALIQSYGGQRRIERAQELFLRAKQSGLVDGRTYVALTSVLCRARRWSEAKIVITDAERTSLATAELYAIAINMMGRAGLWRMIRDLQKRARKANCGQATIRRDIDEAFKRLWHKRREIQRESHSGTPRSLDAITGGANESS
jgi:pentatricopeptide repeat protein